MSRTYPNVVVRKNVRNQSSRNGVRPSIIVVHTTESQEALHSKRDLESIGSWFDNGAAQASSHVCTDGDGNSARYVDDDKKAWHVAAFNSMSLGIEQIGRASYLHWNSAQLKETARWVAYWSKKHGIPIRGSRKGRRSGVARHSDLGLAGGGHSDPGKSYPLAVVFAYARVYRRRMK